MAFAVAHAIMMWHWCQANPSGRLYSLTMNPAPYGSYEEKTVQPIGRARVEFPGADSSLTPPGNTVPAIENWAEITGEILQVEPNRSLSAFVVVQIKVENVSAVGKFPNLFEWAKGKTIGVNFPLAKARDLKQGATITCRVRKSGPDSAFANPDTVRID
jgi:hypothetical protein